MAKHRARLRTAILPGLTLAELAERTGMPRHVLRTVLSSEVGRGRVVTARDGRFCLVEAEFQPGQLDALRALSTPSASTAWCRRATSPRAGGRLPRGEVAA